MATYRAYNGQFPAGRNVDTFQAACDLVKGWKVWHIEDDAGDIIIKGDAEIALMVPAWHASN